MRRWNIHAALRVLLSGLMIAALTGCQSGTAEGRPFGLDDLMQIEGYGSAVFDPAGRFLVYEKIRPYGSYGDYSFRPMPMKNPGTSSGARTLPTGRIRSCCPVLILRRTPTSRDFRRRAGTCW